LFCHQIPHGLGVIPEFHAHRPRSVTGSWPAFHKSFTYTSGHYLYLNSTAARAANTSVIDTVPTSAHVQLTAFSDLNTNNATHIMYAWASTDVYDIGSYYGNLSADGPYVFTRGTPKTFIAKDMTVLAPWMIFPGDATRSYNPRNASIRFDQTTSIQETRDTDFLGQGVKMRHGPNGYGEINRSGSEMMYLACKSASLKYARAQ